MVNAGKALVAEVVGKQAKGFDRAARDALEEIAKCAEIADSAERLKCYDAAAPRVKNALTVPAKFV